MVYDTFILFNEVDLLEMRLAILDAHVDRFIIVEATKTFTGLPKPLCYEENKARYAKWAHKITYCAVTDMPESDSDPHCDQEILREANASPNVPKGKYPWLRIFYQREYIKKGLKKAGVNDGDLCFVSDVDEIWNPDIHIPDTDDVFKLRQKVYAYYLNNRSDEPWAGTSVTKYKNIKNTCLNHLRMNSNMNYVYLPDGGWHFTNMGGKDAIKKKIESYDHQEFNTPLVKWRLKRRIKKNEDYLGRDFNFWVDDTKLPKYILDNQERYEQFFKKCKSYSQLIDRFFDMEG